MAEETQNTGPGINPAPNPEQNGPSEEEEESSVEEGDNSLLLDDEGYVGTTAEYRNAAYDKNAPLRSEDEDTAAAEEAAKDAEVIAAERGENLGHRSSPTATRHPSESKDDK